MDPLGEDGDILYEKRQASLFQEQKTVFRGNDALNQAVEHGTKGKKEKLAERVEEAEEALEHGVKGQKWGEHEGAEGEEKIEEPQPEEPDDEEDDDEDYENEEGPEEEEEEEEEEIAEELGEDPYEESPEEIEEEPEEDEKEDLEEAGVFLREQRALEEGSLVYQEDFLEGVFEEIASPEIIRSGSNGSLALREHGTKGMKWGVRKTKTRHKPWAKVNMAKEMFGKPYKELERPQKEQVKAALRLQKAQDQATEVEPPERKEPEKKEPAQKEPEKQEEPVATKFVSSEKSEKELGSSKITDDKPLGGGINTTRIVTLEDGTKAVFKVEKVQKKQMRIGITPGKDAEREVAAWQIAKIVGMEDLVPVTVLREVDGEKGSMQKFYEGAKIAADTPREDRYDGEKDLRRAAMFDYVIGNEDRWQKNWLVSEKEKKLQLIDHGLSFPDARKFSFGRFGNNELVERVVSVSHEGGKLLHVESESLEKEAKPFVNNKDKILGAMKKLGLLQGAIDGVSSRIDNLKGSTWDTLRSRHWAETEKEKKSKPETAGETRD